MGHFLLLYEHRGCVGETSEVLCIVPGTGYHLRYHSGQKCKDRLVIPIYTPTVLVFSPNAM